MLIYEQEKKDNLSSLLTQNISLSYTTKIRKSELESDKSLIETCSNTLGTHDFSQDLYPFSSILVSTVWNLTDDVFSPVQVYKGRLTATHKPINREHKKLGIIGHSLTSTLYDENYQLINCAED